MIDLVLASLHHLIVFGLVSVLVAEMMLVRPEMTPKQVRSVARLDRIYGLLAVLILIVGFGRVFYGIRGPEFYLGNHVFWTKFALFVIVGLLSLPPTMRILAWARSLGHDENFRPTTGEIKTVKRYMHLEAVVFLAIPVLAAMLARGIGA